MKKSKLLPLVGHTSRRPAVGLLGTVLGTLALGACSTTGTEAPDLPTPSQLVSQHTQVPTASEAPAVPELVLSGEIVADADHLARVFPRVGGEVLRVGADLGDEVHKGQVLAVLRSPEIAALQNQRTAADADLAVATRQLSVAEQLEQAGLASGQDVHNARKAVERAFGNARTSRRQLGVYDVTPGETYTLRAPQAGYVLEKKLSPGMRFNAADVQAAFTVTNLDQVWVLANVFESDLGRVRAGQAVEITTLSYPNTPLRARIDRVADVLDPESKVIKVRCVLPNPGHRLKPGMHAQVRVLADAPAPIPTETL
ncbi:efflux RND transporter periplasmic adaptor subunit [Hymenobacter ruricola]|uniref:Efflux RND transporter periplasmic adaptor subunit n=1 Tax=Hymenobacter ruricola TaxID=2791023 RepID=A0ABS0HZE9_9BACT|nr:efflux RND transporter periplasmic adaptor subunit [Hymenobacter ruricola]MBF9220024.1 efflux RND transporter periplasmic adaptor subunit [Hymenobacter ruricola]